MKILHAVRSDGFAGVERHVAVLARAQLRAGHRVAVIGGDPRSMRVELPDAWWAPASTTVQVATSLLHWRHADVVHAHMTAAETAAAFTTHPRTPLVVTRHFGGRRGRSWAGRAVAPVIKRRVAAQIAISRYVAERVEGPSTVVYPGTSFPAVRTDGRRNPWILAAQRLEAEKRVDVVIRAFAASFVAHIGWRLVIVGDGSQRHGLAALADAEGVGPFVDFVGRRDDVADWMAQASIFISGCEVEGLGLAVVEAMALGQPVVAAAAAGHLETVGLWGDDFMFPIGDVPAAARVLTHLVSDEKLRDAYGSALQKIQQLHFTTERQELDTRSVYERVLA